MAYWAVSAFWGKTEPEGWDLEKTKQRQALKRLENEGPREAGSQGLVGQQDGKP